MKGATPPLFLRALNSWLRIPLTFRKPTKPDVSIPVGTYCSRSCKSSCAPDNTFYCHCIPSESHPALVLRPFDLRLFFFIAPCYFTRLNLRSVNFVLTRLGPPPSVILTPYFLWEYFFLILPFWFTPFFQQRNYGVKRGLCVTFLFITTLLIQSFMLLLTLGVLYEENNFVCIDPRASVRLWSCQGMYTIGQFIFKFTLILSSKRMKSER